MSRKRARTLQHGPEITAKDAIGTAPFDTNSWQLDSNAPYSGYINPSISGPIFKARRTSTGRMPTNIPEESHNITVYEPEDYVHQTRAFSSSNICPNTRPQRNLNDHCIPPSSLTLPSAFSTSPTTTVSESFTNTTPPTSTAMSRQGSLGASFCGAFAMMRAGSGNSEIGSGQNMCRQDSCYVPNSQSSSPDGQRVLTSLDPSIYLAHTGGTAIETSSASMLAATTLEFETETNDDLSPPSLQPVENLQLPSPLDLHTTMTRNTSSDSNLSSSSRISRRSQEQIAQAARPIAPKDVVENKQPKPSSSPFCDSQDMLRQRSVPGPKLMIPKVSYSRDAKVKLKCERCNKNPDGYRGSHELNRHMSLDHNTTRTAWVCIDISSNGFLSGCAACEASKPYGQDYNAAAHLRRFHFHPKPGVRRVNVDPEERRGGKGGGKDPSMSECRRWMKKIQVCGKDYTTLDDSAVNHTSDDIVDGDEESSEQQREGEQAEMVEDPFLFGNGDTFASPDNSVGQQNVSSLYGAMNLDLCLTDNGQFNSRIIDAPFSQSAFQTSGFQSPLDYTFDDNAANLTTPSIGLAYSRPTLSSSAPAASSFLRGNSAELAQAHNNLDSNNPDSYDCPSSMGTTRSPHTPEDLSVFPTSYRNGNFPYGLSSPNNPQSPYGLLDSPPFP